MSEKLEYIGDNGISQFLVKEQEKWKCPACGRVICCHNDICFTHGLSKWKSKKKPYGWCQLVFLELMLKLNSDR